MKKQSSNPYKFFQYTEIEEKVNELIENKYSTKVMEKFVEYGIPPVGAVTKEAEELYTLLCDKNPSLRNRQHDYNKFVGYLVGQKLEKLGYQKTGSRGKIKGKFFKTGTKFMKSPEGKVSKEAVENPFSKLAGIVKIGNMSNEEIDNVIYES